jgi:hypothetical protein
MVSAASGPVARMDAEVDGHAASYSFGASLRWSLLLLFPSDTASFFPSSLFLFFDNYRRARRFFNRQASHNRVFQVVAGVVLCWSVRVYFSFVKLHSEALCFVKLHSEALCFVKLHSESICSHETVYTTQPTPSVLLTQTTAQRLFGSSPLPPFPRPCPCVASCSGVDAVLIFRRFF